MIAKNFLIVLLVCAVAVMPAAIPAFGQQEDQSRQEESLFVAQKAFDDGFYDVALNLLERFIQNYPGSPRINDANLLMGQCYFHLGRFFEALKKFDELIKGPAKDIKDAGYYWAAEVHFRGNNFTKAAEYYRAIVTGYPDSYYAASAYYSLGWCMFQEQKYKEALDYFRQMEERFPRHAQTQEASFKILECLYNLKDHAALRESSRQYLKQFSQDIVKSSYLNFYIAESEYYLDNFQAAIDAYAKVISSARDPKLEALSKLGQGWSYLKLKDFQKAQQAFDQIKPETLEKKSLDVLYLGRAAVFSQTGRHSQAQAAYDELIRTTEDPAALLQAHIGRAEALYNLGDYKAALETYRSAASGSMDGVPSDIVDKLHYGMAWAYLKEGEFKDAISEFKKIVRSTEDKIFKVSALCQIGDAYQDSGEFDKAVETYDTILRDHPDSFYTDYVQYQLGLVQIKMQNYDGAIASFSSVRSNFPNSKMLDEARYALGLAYFQKQDYGAARATLEQFLQEYKESSLRPQAMYLLGTSLYNLGKYDEAIDVFKSVARLYGQDAQLAQKAEFEIADCYYRMGNEKEALARFNALRARYPNTGLTAEIMWWLGEYYYRQNDLLLAVRYFTSLIQDFPDSTLVLDAHYALGSIYSEEERFAEAQEQFSKVMASGKSDLAAQAAIAVADLLVRQGERDQAVAMYQEKLKDYPDLAHLIYPKIADIRFQQGRYDDAISLYKKALTLVPLRQMADIQFKAAEVFQTQGKTSAAIEEYLKVLYLYSGNKALEVRSLLRVAKIYEDEENIPEAIRVYERIRAMDVPEAKFAAERIEACRKQ
ncbi:MAG: tetratricopeptide repeat protein [Candidatus Omnitrophica bacterium]|nr:tetratricopeptide repeat protein [Candidatus Omnitrophota bacterium]